MALNVFFDLDALKSLPTLSWDESNECVTNKSILYYAYWIMNFGRRYLSNFLVELKEIKLNTL